MKNCSSKEKVVLFFDQYFKQKIINYIDSNESLILFVDRKNSHCFNNVLYEIRNCFKIIRITNIKQQIKQIKGTIMELLNVTLVFIS